MLKISRKKQTDTPKRSPVPDLAIATTMQQTISSLEGWNEGFNSWMGSIAHQIRLKNAEIEALTTASKVGGWLSDKEASELFRIASWVPEENAVCCELGSWLGKSSVILGNAIKYKKNPKLYCIDPFDLLANEPWHKECFQEQAGPTDLTRKQVVANMVKSNGLDSVVELVEDFSENYINKFDQAIDLLFIDADHAYESVIRDYNNWAPLVKSGGFIAFHDYHSQGGAHEGPRRAVNEAVVNNDEWPTQWLVDTLYVAQKA